MAMTSLNAWATRAAASLPSTHAQLSVIRSPPDVPLALDPGEQDSHLLIGGHGPVCEQIEQPGQSGAAGSVDAKPGLLSEPVGLGEPVLGDDQWLRHP